MKIITVDDSSVMRAAIAGIIEALGHEALQAGDGLEGLTALRGGARDFLPKPFTPEMLSTKIAQCCPPQ